MQELVKNYLNELGEKQKKRRRIRVIVAAFAVVVVGSVAWSLIQSGSAMTGDPKCGMEEHTHTDSCYTNELTCGQEEDAGHTHTGACYQTEQTLVCGQEESEAHAHTDACYQTVQTLICGQEEHAGHTHTDACYSEQLTCGKEEHIHTDACFVDGDADVEDEAQWAAQYENTEWEDAWGEDLVIAAKEQLDYQESVANYIVGEDGSHKGYTRYGQFAGENYIDWDAAFVNFCMYYAGLTDSEMFPDEKSTSDWYDKFVEVDEGKNIVYLANPDGYEPEAGDIIFTKRENEETEVQMGIISSYDKEKNEIKVIEGNSDNRVKENTYAIDDEYISEYLMIGQMEQEYKKQDDETAVGTIDGTEEEGDEPANQTEIPSGSIEKIYEDDTIIVKASYEADAEIPEEAELIAEQITAEGNEEHYAEREAEFRETLENEEAVMKALLKIGFYVDGEEVEPKSTVTITVQFLDENGLAEGKPVTIVHFADQGAEVLDGSSANNNSTTFQTESFSEFAIGEEAEAIAKGESFPVNKSFLYEDELYHITFRVVGKAFEKKAEEMGIEEETTELSEEEKSSGDKAEEKEVIAKDLDTETESKYQFKVRILDKNSEEYKEFAQYAEETGEGETQFSFQVLKYSLFYDETELDLTECTVTAEISTTEYLKEFVQIKEEEMQGEVSAETGADEKQDLPELKRESDSLGGLLNTSVFGEKSQSNVLGTMASVAQNEDVLKVDGDNLAEDAEVKDGVLVTVYGLTKNAEMSKLGETAVGDEKLSEPTQIMTVTAESDAVGLDTSSNPNPSFTVQYYSELERIKPVNVASTPELKVLVDNINAQTSGSGKFTAQKAIIQNGYIPMIDTSGGKLPENKLTQNVMYLKPVNTTGGEIATESVMTKIYRDKSTEYRRQPNLNYFDALLKNDSYELYQVWVLKPVSTGTKTLICEEHTHGSDCMKDGKVVCGKEEHTTHTDECYLENWKKVNYTKGLTHFTNRQAFETTDENAQEQYIYIPDNAIIRLVYNRAQPKDETLNAVFYDYDISSKNETTNGVTKLYTGEAGINIVARTNGQGAKYAFGNSNNNGGTGYGALTWGTNLLNAGNQANVYKGCTFGMVTGMTWTEEGRSVTFDSEISAPKDLFNFNNINGAKQVYKDGSLTYKRDGDTYTLISADSTAGNASNLNKFNHPTCNTTTYDHIWTNNFWPMDGVSWSGRTDINFGAWNKKTTQLIESDWLKGSVPTSDDGKDHNSYFGMTHQVEFELSPDYVGPLEYYFFGDDDLWVFLDDQLVCDVGGVHSSVGEYVNLWNYLEQGSSGKHTLSFFYTERGASGSTCWMQFTLPSVTMDEMTTNQSNYGDLRVEKDVKQDNGETEYNGTHSFQFEINFTKEDGSTLGDDYAYTKHDASGKELEYNVVLHDGSLFELKDGEYIIVHDIPQGTRYTITERDGTIKVGDIDYAYVPTITVDGTPVTDSELLDENKATGTIPSDGTSVVKYTNNFTVYKLPSTGGSGIYVYMFSGMLLILGASLITYRKKCRGVLRS